MTHHSTRPLAVSLTALALSLGVALAAPAQAQDGTFRVGIVTFLSGGAAGPFGIPSANAAEVVVAGLNAGEVPAPYTMKGINGLTIETVVIDENGGATKQVEEYRNLVQRQGVDAVIGYVSSGDCLAIAPVAEELKTLTILYDCGTPRVFEENADPKYVFRTGLDATADNVAAALYLAKTMPGITRVAGIQQNYAWGQDSWADFTAAMTQVMPQAEVVEAQFPKIFQGQYGAEISALSVKRPEVVHSSFWGGDMEAFVLQANARGLLEDATAVLTTGESALSRFGDQAPDGMIIGGRGPFGAFAPDNALNTWFTNAYEAEFSEAPTYPSTKMAQAILGLKHAVEKAAGAEGEKPSTEAIIEALAGAEFASPSGTVRMARANGHQAMQGVSYGRYKNDGGKGTLTDVIEFAGECVTPPDGTAPTAWIEAGMPGAQCD